MYFHFQIYHINLKSVFGIVGIMVLMTIIHVRTNLVYNSAYTEIPIKLQHFQSEDGKFRLYPNVCRMSEVSADDYPSVSLVTQMSLERLYSVVKILVAWNGPISISLFIQQKDFATLVFATEYFKKCYPKLEMSIHVATTYQDDLIETTINPNMDQIDCNTPAEVLRKLLNEDSIKISNTQFNYPQNLLRNLGRNNCGTKYSLTIDGDFVPSLYLFEMLDPFLQKLGDAKERVAFVLPVYEMDKKFNQKMPGNVEALLEYIVDGNARIYHIEDENSGQKCSNITKWEKLMAKQSLGSKPIFWNIYEKIPKIGNVKVVEELYDIAHCDEKYEPFVVIHQNAPQWNETFVGFGSNRNSHIYELMVKRFSFSMISSGFLFHRGLTGVSKHSFQRINMSKNNFELFQNFKRDLLMKTISEDQNK